MIAGSVESVLAMKDELAKLRLFKAKTHAFLDEMGIDRCVGVEGCRAGARSHLLRESLAAIRTTLAEEVERLKEQRAACISEMDNSQLHNAFE